MSCANVMKRREPPLLTCLYLAPVWGKCASLFGININLIDSSSIWERVRGRRGDRSLVAIVVATIYWNIRRERNDKIFNSTSHMVGGCVTRTYIDASF